ncbi:RNA polymerase sigma factor [Leptospira idonii]|uniref:RNA polymerase sigma factor n=1 Tax=Leptospira idonii TaxID=1193500 RepID=UPI0014385D5B|nr:RNA polymerase sigma factor [Leptospira idonii]
MTNLEFEKVISTTKWAVLSAIRKYLDARLADNIDDVAQETYIRMYRYLQKNGWDADKIVSLGNWAYTIAKNESLRFTQKQNKERVKAQKVFDDPFREEETSFEGSLLDRLEYEKLLQEIPSQYKDVLVLLGEGKTGDQIAAQLHIAPGTVKSRLFRAKRFIYEKFQIQQRD